MAAKEDPERSAETILAEIARMISQIRYGEVIITLHEGRVTQLEKREKQRLVKP